MAPAHPPGGRAFSAVGTEPALDHSPAESTETGNPETGDPVDQGEGWRTIPGEQKRVSHGPARVSPDPLRTTDRYRLVTPFKLKL